ncbi:polysaccharide biosynthesis protein (plasmid) [Peteryoungia desertarenae]|uniref:Polysaccharide biosynthesis protein n=1 Tax=Peteryoungia desertarenae TaxID=1813451 RepID=A0ABX6QT15_9HYPH|nr:nucleoside-diphosphate sugar epimerase/dehydratase [Peteryoungia desertarenae]QLF71738.1 polysaccharide biosynthesis protein [Peteryoungia desertarenae]
MIQTDDFIVKLLHMPRLGKRLLALTVDAALCALTVWLAFCLRLDSWVVLSGVQWMTIPASIAIAIPIFVRFGLYRAIFRFIGWSAFFAIVKAVSLYGLIYLTIFTTISIPTIPRTVGILQPLLLLIAVGMSRLVVRYFLGESYRRILSGTGQSNVLIYGAGSVGRQLTSALENSGEQKVVGFLDDDKNLHGSLINGIRVHDPAELSALVAGNNVKTVLLALPKLKASRRKEIIENLRGERVAVRLAPNVSEIAKGMVDASTFQDLDVNDLLGREPVAPDETLLTRHTRGKVVLVTGAGGSIGSELCRQIMAVEPQKLLLIEQSEFALYSIHAELTRQFPQAMTCVVPMLASVRDEKRIRDILASWKVDTIYHAAAYKHVPLVEHNPVEGIRNNVFGTLVIARAAIRAGVKNFVLVSTDKAVRPTNIMGASKRLAEMTLQALSETGPGTRLSMVRFGNVLGSSGSVVPLFREQIRNGGPITLTHPEITRFFMTIPEASQLVIQAGAMAEGGDVFVLDMGEPVRIMDLARRMVELSGLTVKDDSNPDGNIEFVTTGLRPAEKLYEELLIGDNPTPSPHPLIMRAREDFLPWSRLETSLKDLERCMDKGDVRGTKALLASLVSGYTPTADIVDFVSIRRTELEADVEQARLADETLKHV